MLSRNRCLLGLLACATVTVSAARAADLEFAHGLYRQQRYALAVQEYEGFLREQPNSPQAGQAAFFLAESYTQLGQPQKALPLYQRVLDRLPVTDRHHRLALFRTGQLALEEDAEKARIALARFVERYPDDELLASAYYLLGEVHLAQDRTDEAARAFQQSLRSNPDSTVRTNIEYGLAKLAERTGDRKTALEHYRSLSGRKGASIADDALLAYGVLLYEDRRIDEALRVFESLPEQFPDSDLIPTAELNRGLCLHGLGRYNEAIATFRRITDRGKENAYAKLVPQAWLYLGRALAGKGDVALAAQTLRNGAGQMPEPERVRLLIESAILELDFGDNIAALESLQSITQQYPDAADDRTWYYICLAASRLEKAQVADQAFSQLQSRFPSSPWKDRAAVVVVRSKLDSGQTADQNQIQQWIAQAKEPASKRRLQYYLALADFRNDQFAEAYRTTAGLLTASLDDPQLQQDCQYLAGISLIRMGQASEAVEHLAAYLQASDDPVLAKSAATQLGKAVAQLPEAEADKFLQSLGERIQDAGTLGTLADGLYDGGRTAQAIELYNNALKRKPSAEDRQRLSIGLAWCLVSQEQFAEAARRLQGLPGTEAAYLTGICQQELGNTQAALAAFEIVLTDAGNQYRVDSARRSARLLNANGQYAEADQLLENVANDSNSEQQREILTYERALLAADADRAEEARQLFESFVESYPESASTNEAMLKLAELEFALGRFDRSLNWTEKLQARKPPAELQVNLLYRRGIAAYRLKEYSTARDAFEELARQPDSQAQPLAEFWLAEVAFEQADPKEARGHFEKLLAQPVSARFHGLAQLRIAQLFLKERDWQQAYEAAERVSDYSEEPSHRREASFVQGKALAQQARFDDARKHYTDAIASARDELAAKSQFMIAETFLHQRDHRQALREYLKVDILYPYAEWRSMALLQIGKCHQALGEEQEARKVHQQLLEQFPQSEAARMARDQQGS